MHTKNANLCFTGRYHYLSFSKSVDINATIHGSDIIQSIFFVLQRKDNYNNHRF